jgi:exopolysaccharide production protein ExoQ
MTPLLASILCGLFVLCCFLFESRSRLPKFSSSLLFPLIWLLYCSSKPIAYWLDTRTLAGDAVVEGSPYDRLFLSAMIFCGIVALARRRLNWSEFARQNRWLILLFAYMGISILWSNYPDVSFKRWVRTCGDLLMATIIVTDEGMLESAKRLLRFNGYIIIPFSILLIKYFPHIGMGYDRWDGYPMYVGVTTHKNDLGQVAMILGIVFVFAVLESWIREKKLDVVSVVLLVLVLWVMYGPKNTIDPRAQNKTSVNALIISLMVMASAFRFLKNRPERLRTILFLIPVALVGCDLVAELFFDMNLFELAIRESGRNATLTGRTDLWAVLLDIGFRNPVFGRGFGGFWLGTLTPGFYDKFPWRATTGHNGYIDVFIDLGVVGLLLLLLVTLSNYNKIKEHFLNDFSAGVFVLTCTVCILLHNITESSLIKPTSILWFMFILISIVPVRPYSNFPEDQGILSS